MNGKRRAQHPGPEAKTLSDLITPKQLGAIYKRANSLGLNATAYAQGRYGCRPEDMTRLIAAVFIARLDEIARREREAGHGE